MRAKPELTVLLKKITADLGQSWPDKITLETPKESRFGDLAVNLAMLLAKPMKRNPRELAGEIAQKLLELNPDIVSAEVAGPGFINITFSREFWRNTVPLILESGADYGRSQAGGGKKAQVEFVSANPTGPLHIGHGRGAAIGDSMARIMRFAGYDVHTEYYINDAGKQMRILGLSVWLRLMELAGRPVPFPDDWYRGEYIIDIAREMLEKYPAMPDMASEEAQAICFEAAMQSILEGIKSDLKTFRVGHEVWFSEQSLVADGAVERAFDILTANGHSYEQDEAFWFRTTDLGDDKDRVLRKSDGSLTYFASDIAYHADKFRRGFEFIIDVWGADHHGYIPRMRAAIAAMGKPRDSFDVILVQLVNLMQNGQQIAMSTRAGKFETLIDVINEVGVDAARFMFLSRKSDSPLDFDLELVKQRSLDNPVYYVQYAHARICSIQRRANESGLELPGESSGEYLQYLVEDAEFALLRRLDAFTELVASAAQGLAPHHVSYYLLELARELHGYYASCKVLNAESRELVMARLYLLSAVRRVLANGLDLLGVSAPENM
ncbi:MAG: arginine--tRNA ligase [Deltaproteobacteria bacterium]|jgi:arginyl-tRNA synthetase|nr:arginine--tRNA ligase [Deltaproteobacteria bacterium]